MSTVNVGDPAPDFELDSTVGEKVRLSGFRGKKNVLLAFYPLDFTAVCTNENCAFTTDYAAFEDAETAVLPISVDSIPTHNEFRAKHQMSHHLLSDFQRKVSQDYGVLTAHFELTRRRKIQNRDALLDREVFSLGIAVVASDRRQIEFGSGIVCTPW
jgi:peroxiredoxin